MTSPGTRNLLVSMRLQSVYLIVYLPTGPNSIYCTCLFSEIECDVMVVLNNDVMFRIDFNQEYVNCIRGGYVHNQLVGGVYLISNTFIGQCQATIV